MSFIYSQALGEAFLRAAWSGTDASVQSSETPTPRESSSSGRTTEAWTPSPCGTTLQPSTDAHGEALLTWWREASRAKTSATAATRLASTASAPACGERWPASLARFDPDSSSWRTSQRCLVEGWAQFSQTWPSWGLMRDGECWAPETSAAPKAANGYGLWPTLKASDGDQYSRNFDYFKRRRLVAPDLPVIVALSTPATPMGFYGRLNPDWCEWLTGWPIGWTASGQSATAKTREWLQLHGKS